MESRFHVVIGVIIVALTAGMTVAFTDGVPELSESLELTGYLLGGLFFILAGTGHTVAVGERRANRRHFVGVANLVLGLAIAPSAVFEANATSPDLAFAAVYAIVAFSLIVHGVLVLTGRVETV